MNYLITGATGFIGQSLCPALSSRGHDVIALSRSGGSLPCGLTTRALDLAKGPPPAAWLMGVDAVIHLAGMAHQQAPEAVHEQLNHRAAVELAEAAASAGVGHFVYLSSVKAMGAPTGSNPRDECDSNEPRGAYGRAKRRAEEDLGLAFRQGPMSVTILRPALVYGAQAQGNLALLATAVGRALPRPPDLGGRSMIALEDLVDLILSLAEVPPTGFNTWIVCDGEHYSTRRLHDALRRAAGRPPGRAWWPRWLWRLGAGGLDLLRPLAGDSTWERLFGTELYTSAALRSARDWQPARQFEEVAPQLLSADTGAPEQRA